MTHWEPSIVAAAVLALLPLLGAALFPQAVARYAARPPAPICLFWPALLCLPYLLVATSAGAFRLSWFALYALLPVLVAAILWRARQTDPERRGIWADYAVLALLGLAVDLRWFEPAWPAHLGVFNKIILLDAGIYGFLAIRELEGVGFNLRIQRADLPIGLRELCFYVPLALPLGLALGFLHLHLQWPVLTHSAFAWCFTFLFVAIPEELFFRGWLQNLLERRIGRGGALLLTAAIFGLSHFNKRTTGLIWLGFNWRYVLLAAIAGIFYGRAWRSRRRVVASAITHASVDTLWSLFLR